MSLDIRQSPMLGSLWHPFDKVGSITLFSSEDALRSVSLSNMFSLENSKCQQIN